MKLKIFDVNYHLELAGQGEALLLLHGFSGSLEDWQPFIKDWACGYQMIMPDILGHGKSEIPENPVRFSIEKIAADLKGLLDKLNIRKAHLLGYSMGGRLALTFAVKYPTYVSSLILTSSSPGLKTEQERNERITKDEALADFILRQGPAAFAAYWGKLPLFLSQQSLPAAVRDKIHHRRLTNNALGLANSLRGMGTGKQPAWWSHLSELNLPVNIVVGERDEKFCNIARQMNAKLPNAITTVVEKVGHAVHIENPEMFSQIVLNYLNKHREGAKWQ